jgi:hypothetical protein
MSTKTHTKTKTQWERANGGDQRTIAELAATGKAAKEPKTAAQRAADYRAKKKEKAQATETRAAWANLQQGGAPRMPVLKTKPDAPARPDRWASVPTIAPKVAAPDPNAPVDPNAPPPAPGASRPVVAAKKKEPTEAEQEAAKRAAKKFMRLWNAGAFAAAELGKPLLLDPTAPLFVKLIVREVVDVFTDKDNAKVIEAAAIECALKYGIATTLAPPPEVIVIGSGLAAAGALGIAYISEQNRKEAAAAKDGNPTPPAEEPPPKSAEPPATPEETALVKPKPGNWSSAGFSVPKGG